MPHHGESNPPNLPRHPKDPKGLHRTVSDITCGLSKEPATTEHTKLTTISEVKEVKCECCGMSEECTPEYVSRVRERFLGKWICGLCSEAVKEEIEKNGGKKEEALGSHMSACVSFNKLGRAYPVLCQAEAMRKIFKKSQSELRARQENRNGGIARSSSCMSAISRGMRDLK